MATILVKSDVDEAVLMNERVEPIHLDSEQSSVQFLERLAWAVEEAEKRRKMATARGTLHRQAEVAREERGRVTA